MVNFASQEKKSCWEITPHCDFAAVLEGQGLRETLFTQGCKGKEETTADNK